eukprot:Clim_evm77s153 gene=Clim_evmTU77s153
MNPSSITRMSRTRVEEANIPNPYCKGIASSIDAGLDHVPYWNGIVDGKVAATSTAGKTHLTTKFRRSRATPEQQKEDRKNDKGVSKFFGNPSKGKEKASKAALSPALLSDDTDPDSCQAMEKSGSARESRGSLPKVNSVINDGSQTTMHSVRDLWVNRGGRDLSDVLDDMEKLLDAKEADENQVVGSAGFKATHRLTMTEMRLRNEQLGIRAKALRHGIIEQIGDCKFLDIYQYIRAVSNDDAEVENVQQ